MSGWYAVKRGITEHHLFKGKPERLIVWMWLMDNAAWKDTTHDVQGVTVTVPRGSVCASERHIAEACGIGRQVVRTTLKRFRDDHMINQNLTHGKNIISLCNYEKYQDPKIDANPKLTQGQPKANPQKEQGNKGTSIRGSKEPLGDLGFSDFWKLWPSKKSKEPARRAWARLSIEDRRAAFSAIRGGWFDRWREDSPEASPIHAATFLNQKRWEDEQQPKFKAINGGQNGQSASKSKNRMDAFIGGARGSS